MTKEFSIDESLRTLIPSLSEAEIQQLEANLVKDGCRDPLVVWNEKGVLLDGHHRYEICRRLKLPYKTERLSLSDRKAAQTWVIRNQFGRRNLTPLVRAELALKLEPLIAAKAKSNQGKRTDISQKSVKSVDTQKEVAKVAGLSHDTIAKAKVVLAKAPEETKAKLRAGQTTINAVYSGIKRKEKEKERTAKETTALASLPKKRCRLINADFVDAMKQEKAQSVDVIITDPPYPREFLPLYAGLAEQSARLLKPGGSLVVMVGQSYLPEVFTLMTPHIQYQWSVAYLTPGGQSVQLWQRKVNTFWKPVLWFTNGDYKGEWVGDVAKSAVNDNDKRFHEWEQSSTGMIDLVERFSKVGDLILDPFMGSGTTGLAALALNRQFVGIEADAKTFETAEKRLK